MTTPEDNLEVIRGGAQWAGGNHEIPVLNHLGLAHLLCIPGAAKPDMDPQVIVDCWNHVQKLLATAADSP